MFDTPARVLTRLRQPWRLAAAVLLAWLAWDLLLYRSGLAYWAAEPDSNAGAVVVARMLAERELQASSGAVLVFGDSRVGEGLSMPIASAEAGLQIVNASVPGSKPRTWYYLLRALLRDGHRIDAIALGVDYAPLDLERFADWPLDPAHQAPLVGLADAREWPASFDSPAMQARARDVLALPALAMREDARAALASPLRRLKRLLRYRPQLLAAIPGYGGNPARMPVLDFTRAGEVVDPAPASEQQLAQVRGHANELRALVDPAVRDANEAYARRWYGALATLAAEHDLPVVVFPLPRGPYRALLPPHPVAPRLPAVLAGHANVSLLPIDAFEALETPESFHDTLHLNAQGRARFSAQLGAALRASLGVDRAASPPQAR